MAKRNYSKYYEDKNEAVEVETAVEVEAAEVVAETPAPEVKMVEETVETVTLPETVTGVIANCSKLNVRAKPDATADVVCVLDVASELVINVSKSNDEWFCVCTATGVDGYCMRKFVDAHL